MARKKKTKTGNTRRKTAQIEPLAESTIPLRENGQRNWASMSDEELIYYAKKIVSMNGIKNKKGLKRLHDGLHKVLYRRKLLNKIGLIGGNRSWASMDDKTLLGYARTLIKEKRLASRTELKNEDGSLFNVLRERDLIERIGLESRCRSWASFSDMGIVEYAKELISRNNVKTRSELGKIDSGLFRVLCKRNLLDHTGLENTNADDISWASMSDRNLVEFAKRIIKEKGIKRRHGLEKAVPRLYRALKKRRLLDETCLVNTRANQRYWVSMSDGEMVEFARSYIEERGITTKSGLTAADCGLFAVLYRRNLLGLIGLKQEFRDWASMDDQTLVKLATRIKQEKKAERQSALREIDSGLHAVLYRRKLINHVFPSQQKVTRKIKKRRQSDPSNKRIRRFSDEELETIVRRRDELITEYSDPAISKTIGKEISRNPHSVYQKIIELIEAGRLEDNPNKRELQNFDENEVGLIGLRREELIGEGLSDCSVSEKIAKEIERSHGSVHAKIRRLVKAGTFQENPHNKNFFGDQETDLIIKKRNEYALQGLTDNEIAKRIAQKIHAGVGSVSGLIYRLVKGGELEENKNKRRNPRFTKEEIDSMIRERKRLMSEGLCDSNIAKKIAQETGRSEGSVGIKMLRLMRSGKLPENPNNRDRSGFTSVELGFIRQKRDELISSGMTDGKLSRLLSRELDRSVGSIREKIRLLVRSGILKSNPNKRGVEPTRNVLLEGLSQAAEAMEAFGERR